jgi:hypothetical protein
VWKVLYHPTAQDELDDLRVGEKAAIEHVVDKLAVLGPVLSHPHQSNVQGAASLRELGPRGGRSPWRAFYQRVGDVFVIAAVEPEAQADRRGFDRAVRAALARLEELYH